MDFDLNRMQDALANLDPAVYVIVVLSLALVIYVVLNLKNVPLPGPFEYPLVYNLPQLWGVKERMLDALMGYAGQYDWKVFTFRLPLTPRFLVVLSPENVKHVLQDNFKNYPKGKFFQQNLGELLGNGIFNADGKLWETQRKTSLPMFSTEMMKEVMQPTFQKHLQTACTMFDKAAKTGEVMNFFDFANRFTLDSIGEIGFGKDIKSLATPDHPFASAFDGVQSMLEQRFFNPLWPVTEWIDGTRTRIRQQVQFLDSFCLDLIKERRESGAYKTSDDVLSRFMRLKDKAGKPVCLDDDKFLRDLVLNYLIAGRDTSAQALSWTAYCLAQSPRVLKKMRAEIAAMYAAREGASTAGSSQGAVHGGERTGAGALTPTYYEVRKQLSYTTDVARETLRLFPSVPKDVKIAACDDVLPDKTRVPAGCQVVYSPFAMGRWTKLWGEDAAEFRPERWAERRAADAAARAGESQGKGAAEEEEGKEQDTKDGAACPVSGAAGGAQGASGCPMSGGAQALPKLSDYMYPTFNAGKRSCLGKEMALLEITTILATLYHRYDLEALHCGGQKITEGGMESGDAGKGKALIGARTDLPYGNSLTMPQAGGLRVKVSLRQ